PCSLAALALCAFGFRLLPSGARKETPSDTTSSNFAWTVDTIGADGSTLYDCCVVNDSLAYAVGWIMPEDSAARKHSLNWYNAAVWNGSKWTPMQVPVYFKGRKTFSPIHSVFARNKDDVWFGMYYMVHWNGHRYSQVFPRIRSFENKIWESKDGSELYAVGDYGMISYSPDHGKSWEVVRTGTGLPFQDIWGAGDQVLAVASDHHAHEYLIKLIGDSAVRVNGTFPFARSISGVWFVPNREYFLVGNGIFENTNLNQKVWRYDPFIWHLNRYQFAVRGNSANDVFIAGQSGSVAHWNGKNWRSYPDVEHMVDRLQAVSVKGNVVIAVGQRYYSTVNMYGVIYTGERKTVTDGYSTGKKERTARVAVIK
ncbi:MAG: hypothetical protein M1395_07355, partial [Bacteroidetes bacterium]|nr:hypothetical protein [Bacteroidota bacterium]